LSCSKTSSGSGRMRTLVSARIQRIFRSLSISSVVGRGTSLFIRPFSCTRPYFFVASRSGSESTGNGRSKALASAGVIGPTATTATREFLKSSSLGSSPRSAARQARQYFPRKKIRTTRPWSVRSLRRTSFPSWSFSMKSGARSPTATLGVPSIFGIVRSAIHPPSPRTKTVQAPIFRPRRPSPPQARARSAAGKAKKDSVHQPLRKAGTPSRRMSAIQTPTVERMARTSASCFIA